MDAVAKPKCHLAGWVWFSAWVLVGVGYGLAISVIGIFTFIPATLGVIFLTRRRPIRGAWGVATGAGSVLLFVAYHAERDGSYNPVHWFIPGFVLFMGGILAHAWANRTT
jgi:hypothetical protein